MRNCTPLLCANPPALVIIIIIIYYDMCIARFPHVITSQEFYNMVVHLDEKKKYHRSRPSKRFRGSRRYTLITADNQRTLYRIVQICGRWLTTRVRYRAAAYRTTLHLSWRCILAILCSIEASVCVSRCDDNNICARVFRAENHYNLRRSTIGTSIQTDEDGQMCVGLENILLQSYIYMLLYIIICVGSILCIYIVGPRFDRLRYLRAIKTYCRNYKKLLKIFYSSYQLNQNLFVCEVRTLQ